MQKKNIRGWFSVNPYKRTNIYETDRQTNEVGIYAECSVCRRKWQSNESIYSKFLIPDIGREFKIQYIQMDSNGEYTVDLNCGFKSFKEVTSFIRIVLLKKENIPLCWIRENNI